MKLLTKKNVLSVSLVLSAILITWDYIGNYALCNVLVGSSTGDCPAVLAGIESSLFIFFPVFVFSLISYFFKDPIFRSWLSFTFVWVPVLIILELISPDNDYGHGWIIAGPSTREMVSFFGFWMYVILSALIILIVFGLTYSTKKR